MEKKIERIGLGGAGYYDSKTNTFVIIKQPFGKNFNLKQIVTYMNENGFTTYGNRPIKPEQCTGGNGCEVYYKGLKFYIYLNNKGVKKIGPNRFTYNCEAYKIINKIIKLVNSFGVYTVDKKKVRIINKHGEIESKRLPKLDTNYIYGNTLFQNKDDAKEFANKLLIINGVNCSVTNMVDYWNKTIQVD